MPLTGTLRDLSLPNLVQVQCSEQNQSRVVITRGKRQGTLIFANGELIYATVGDLTGENAVYELLTWEEGDFRVDDQVPSLERNVTTPWSALLIEGLRRADEARAERDHLLETRLRALKNKIGVRGARVFRLNGAVRAEAPGEEVPGDARTVMLVYANVEQIQKLLNLDTPRQIVFSNAQERIWVQKLQDDYFAGWFDSRVVLDEIAKAVQEMMG
ncbi:MAG: DUF4388 domain-containing protein [Anaerolineae bacterium]|nr:DUF4388 domain-containing protein [Anaerolineae bacterium]